MRRKILHIVGSMSRGGVETWLMNIMRKIDRDHFEFHFLVSSNTESAYDQEIIALGGHVHYGAITDNLFKYTSRFKSVIRKCGPFAVVHSHVYWYSGFITQLGYVSGIPIRIAHSHTAASSPAWRVDRRMYQTLMRCLIMRYSTHRLGVSQQAAQALFGRRPAKPFILLYYGLDFTRFLQRDATDRAKWLLSIPPGRKVIGHVGRFMPVKNHAFTVEFFERIVRSGTDAHLLFVGDGALAPTVKALVESRGLMDRCTFAGLQSDVAPFFSAMDAFVLPSLWEGLPLVALEAQAAGVPVIASTCTPEEISAIPRLVERIPLSAGASEWASVVKRTINGPSRRQGDEPLFLQNSRFGLPTCLNQLSRIYAANLN